LEQKMMIQSYRRNDTTEVGDSGEEVVRRLLEERQFDVEMLKRNYPTYDLIAQKNNGQVWISVKTCRNDKRHLRIGKKESLEKLKDQDVMICLLPVEKGKEIDLDGGDFEIWIIPGHIAREEGVAVYEHYHRGTPLDHQGRSYPVMIKDKNDAPNGRSISGATFHRWSQKYKDNWELFEDRITAGF
jgi:hypothetical protein